MLPAILDGLDDLEGLFLIQTSKPSRGLQFADPAIAIYALAGFALLSALGCALPFPPRQAMGVPAE